MYGAPSFYTEYEANLGQAVADPVRLTQLGNQEVWTREFERGYIVVSSMTAAPFNVTFPELVLQLPLSAQPARLTGGREAPAWQFVVDNSPGGGPMPSGNNDWWASAAHRANFRTLQGNWTTVTDGTQSHQIGDSFLVGFSEPGGLAGTTQGFPGAFSAAWSFAAPEDGLYFLATTAVDAHLYPLTNAAQVCIRTRNSSSPGRAKLARAPADGGCIASGAIDQRAGIRDGRWQPLFQAPVALQKQQYYDVVVAWDPTYSGYVAVDALLVESERLYHGNGMLSKQVVVNPLDSRVVLKSR